MTPFLLIGILGTLFILTAFILEQFGVWRDDSLVYALFNFFGSSALIVYAISFVSYPFIILNIAWLIVSVRDIFRSVRRRGTTGSRTV